MSSNKTFVELLKDGTIKPDALDDFVEEWHDRYNGDKPLHEFLGMTWEEYQQITDDPKKIVTLFPVRELVTASEQKLNKIAKKIAEDK